MQNAQAIDDALGGNGSHRTQLGDNLFQRPSTAADDGFLLTLFAESRPDLALLPEAVRSQLIRMQFDGRASQYRSRVPDAVDWILEVDRDSGAEPVGRCHLWRGVQEHRLLDLAILPRWRRHGIASTVLTGLCAHAARAGVPLRLTVWPANHDALRLYHRHGFVAAAAESDDDGEISGFSGYLQLRWSAEGRR